MLAFGAVGALLLFLAINGWRSVYPRWSDVVLIGLGVAACIDAAIVLGALTQRKLWRRRTRAGQVEAERWEAFRRYLTDFPRLQEAPPATLALWERLLVYGIAFGIADRVLQAAHLAMPEELAQASSIYWISPGRQPRLGSDLDRDRRPRLRLRLGARAPVVRLRRGGRRLLRRGRRRRRRWWRRRLVVGSGRGPLRFVERDPVAGAPALRPQRR